MNQAEVYFTKEITPSSLVKIFEALQTPLNGKVAVKISTGEKGGHNFLQPSLIKDLINKVNGTITECNVAYAGARDTTEAHKQTIKEHGFAEIADVDIMDADGEIELPVKNGKHLDVDIVGKNLVNYDAMINLAHFKGHQMAGFGGVLKNQSIGIASANGKAYIHTAGKIKDPKEFMKAFESTETAAQILPPQDDFTESMAEAAKAVADYFQQSNKPVVYIDVMNNLSRDCDCSPNPEAPCMADIGIAASLDPVALDQACLDMVYNSNDPGRDDLVGRIESQKGRHIVDYAAELGLGSKDYKLISID